MTDSELWELILISQGNTSSTLAIYLSLVFGYLAIAYLIGVKLNRSQVATFNGLFLLGGVIGIMPTYAYLSRAAFLLQFVSEDYKSPASVFIPMAPPGVALILCLGLVACLKFMWDIRHPRKE